MGRILYAQTNNGNWDAAEQWTDSEGNTNCTPAGGDICCLNGKAVKLNIPAIPADGGTLQEINAWSNYEAKTPSLGQLQFTFTASFTSLTINANTLINGNRSFIVDVSSTHSGTLNINGNLTAVGNYKLISLTPSTVDYVINIYGDVTGSTETGGIAIYTSSPANTIILTVTGNVTAVGECKAITLGNVQTAIIHGDIIPSSYSTQEAIWNTINVSGGSTTVTGNVIYTTTAKPSYFAFNWVPALPSNYVQIVDTKFYKQLDKSKVLADTPHGSVVGDLVVPDVGDVKAGVAVGSQNETGNFYLAYAY